MLLIDHRENPKLIHKLMVKMGDADKNPKGQARLLQMTSGDYVLGDWGIEAKEINDLYRSILGIGRSRTIVAQLADLCEKFDKPFLVVYNTELKPWFHGRKPTARELSEERRKMASVIHSFKLTMHQRFPKLHFLQLTTMDDFVEWLYINHRQNVIGKIKPPKSHKPEQVILEETDDRVKCLMGCGVSREQAVALLEHYGSIPVLLQKKTRQKDMVKASGITSKQAKRILALRKDFINKA
jgi:ERCC4-type nuclease